ncbi:hypothetical protein HLH26_19910, partial [Gluconacetobacter sp. 1b LMG 1731]
MARIAAAFDGDAGIGDRLGIATISRSFGREQIGEALRASGRKTRRRRDMPEDLTVYFVIAMALLMHVNTREVLRCLWAGLRDVGHDEVRVTGKSGISQARTRLGAEPLRSPASRFFETPDKHVRHVRRCYDDDRAEERRETTGAWG